MKKNIVKNKGMTLTELLVVIAITMVLMTMLAVLLAKTFFINRYTLEQGLNNTQLQNAIRNMSESIREARQSDAGEYLLYKADKSELIFFANIDNDSATERVRYFLENGQLKRGVAEAAGAPPQYPTNDTSVSVVGSGIINTPSQPMFTYYNEDYPEDMTDNPLPTPVVPPLDVSLIRMHLYANVDPNHVPDTMEIETFIKPRNIK
jgi:type II secretory pathway pseudopilin PulG